MNILIVRLLSGLITIAALASCLPAPAPTPSAAERVPPTLAVPEWRAPAAPLTRDSLATVSLLGRLDQPSAASTLFDDTIASDGGGLAALSNDELLVWDLETGVRLWHTARSEATRVLFLPDSSAPFTVDSGGTLRFYDGATGAAQGVVEAHAAYGDALAHAADLGLLALGGSDGTIRVWDVAQREPLADLQLGARRIMALAFSPDGAALAAAAAGQVTVFDWRAARVSAELDLGTMTPARIVFAPSGDRLAVGAQSGVLLWEWRASAEVVSLEGSAAQVLLFAPSGRYLIGGSRADGLALWDAGDGTRVTALPGTQGAQISAAFAPGADLLLTSALDGAVAVWDLDQIDGQSVSRAELPAGTTRILRARWSADNRRLLLFDAAGPVYVWGQGEPRP
jgi:WD40 repeat protein